MPAALAGLMLRLQDKGAHNIDLVTPTPHLHVIRPALEQAKAHGLRIPVVYNTNGYELVDALRTLEGLVDIYLPDLKYVSQAAAGAIAARRIILTLPGPPCWRCSASAGYCNWMGKAWPPVAC